jgi:hypothetical protein
VEKIKNERKREERTMKTSEIVKGGGTAKNEGKKMMKMKLCERNEERMKEEERQKKAMRYRRE